MEQSKAYTKICVPFYLYMLLLIGGLVGLQKLHSLIISNNQLITSRGLSSAPTLQYLDMSHNHLATVDDIQALGLLQVLKLGHNSLMQVLSSSS
jgi:Leucine-rich repeat (LRR) protein